MADKKSRLSLAGLDFIQDSRKAEEEPKAKPKAEKVKAPKPKKAAKPKAERPSSQAGLPKGWTRFAFIVREDYKEKVQGLAYWERKQVKEIMDEALGQYLQGKRIRKRG